VRGSGENSEAIWRNYIQQWKKAGLNVKFLGGRPMEFNRWVAAVKSSDPKIDVLEGSWGAAGDLLQAYFMVKKCHITLPALCLQLILNF
jgi:peptide/nickel transport system substrate-binding protein